MKTVLFVHGTGTRDPDYSKMLDRVREALGEHASVQECYWGEREGSRLNEGGASIPSYNSTRSIVEVWNAPVSECEFDYEIALWELLLRDPLFELRLLTAAADPTEELSPSYAGCSLRFELLTSWRAKTPVDNELHWRISAAGLAPVLADASQIVERSDAFLNAVLTCDRDVCCVAAARAVLATAFLLADDRDLAVPARTDSAMRDKLVDSFALLLGGVEAVATSRGFLRNYLIKPLAGLAVSAGANIASYRIRRRRGAIHDAATANAGDILLYQARGAGIRRFIKNRIDDISTDPVVLLAHSLGGIACVDLLILEKIPKVELLVTVGS